MICDLSQDLPLALQNWHSNGYCYKPSESKLQQIGIIVFNFYLCLLHSEQNLKFTCFLFLSLNSVFCIVVFHLSLLSLCKKSQFNHECQQINMFLQCMWTWMFVVFRYLLFLWSTKEASVFEWYSSHKTMSWCKG